MNGFDSKEFLSEINKLNDVGEMFFVKSMQINDLCLFVDVFSF